MSALSIFSQKQILPVEGASATTPKSFVGPLRTMAPSGSGSDGLRPNPRFRDRTLVGPLGVL